MAKVEKMPEVLAQVNAELRARHAVGLSTEIAEVDLRLVEDEKVGVFARLILTMDDGDKFTVDTKEGRSIWAAGILN